jgi:diguanylate cyclase (GGDEF)-like protein
MGVQRLVRVDMVRKPVELTAEPGEPRRESSDSGESPGRLRPVASVSAGLVAVSATMGTALAFLPHLAGERPMSVPWWLLIVGFACAQSCLVHVQAGRDTRSVSLTEIPLVVGLFVVSPIGLVAGRVLGGFVAQVAVRRQWRQPVKLAFNTCLMLAEGLTAVAVFLAVADGARAPGVRTWVAAVVAAIVANTLSAVSVEALIGGLEGRRWRAGMAGAVLSAVPVATTVSTMGLVWVLTLYASPWGAVPLAVVALAVAGGYRAYADLAQRHETVERLYRFSQVITAHSHSDDIASGILEQVCEMLQAEWAVLALADPFTGLPGSEALLRRGFPLRRRAPQWLTDDASWIVDRVFRAGLSVTLPRETKDIASRHWLDSHGLREALIVPLKLDDVVIAALIVTDRLGEVRGFDGADHQLLQTVANHAGVALRHGDLVDRLRHDSLHDALTGVPNRVFLQAEVERLLALLPTGGAPFAVAMLDLNAFKEVNDTLGHDHGDVLLRQVAQRLCRALDGRGVLTRFGGDEFAVLLPGCATDDEVMAHGQAMLQALTETVYIEGTAIDVSASVGLVRAPEHGTTWADLMKRADLAMYASKQAAQDLVLFQPVHDTSSPSRLALAAELRQAVMNGELTIEVQPQLSLRTGEVVSVEALARWKHPERGSVPPAEFIPLAERTGLIGPLTDFVLEQAVAACAAWQAHAPGVSVGVNLSTRSLRDDGLDELLDEILDRHGLDPRLLTLEITESSVMADPASAMGLLNRLRDRGIRLSIDDFGTGYSSLSYLRRLPVQEVKVDQSFVQRMHQQSEDVAIVRSIIQLARTLELDVVAEGVEVEDQLRLLQDMGCDLAQGYHISRPMPVDAMLLWLSDHKPAPPVVTFSAASFA